MDTTTLMLIEANMKKYLMAFLICLISCCAWARSINVVVGSPTTASNACVGGEILGYIPANLTGATALQLGDASTQIVGMYSGPCTGTFTVAKAWHNTSNSQNSKVLVYLDDGDSTPDSGDSLVCTSSSISSSSDDSLATASISCNIQYGSVYWLAIGPGTAWDAFYISDAGIIARYSTTCENYDSQQSTLSCTFASATTRKYYIGVQVE